MPNHITNKVQAPKEVLATLLNADGRIDFNTIISFAGKFEWNGIDGLAESCVQAISAKRPHQHQVREQIRGKPGKWEGGAFHARVGAGRDASGSQTSQDMTRHAEDKAHERS